MLEEGAGNFLRSVDAQKHVKQCIPCTRVKWDAQLSPVDGPDCWPSQFRWKGLHLPELHTNS